MLSIIQPGAPHLEAAIAQDASIRPLITAAAAGQPLEPVMQSIVEGLGFDSFMYALSTAARPDHGGRSYVWTTLPREWIAIYDKNAYIEVDPRITMSWGRTTPLVWDSATIGGDAKVRRFLVHAAEYGIRSGVAVGFSDPGNARFGVAFNSSISPVGEERQKMIDARLGTLMLLSAGCHEIFMTKVIDRGIPPALQGTALSPREIQCLQMAAHGMTSADIGIKLGIVERTANYHFGNILTKLHALNRHEAIAKGVRLGLIRMHY